ncbi:RidA family protein [Candidatus Viadribacter manganicus]|uniref:Enamine deaminase RidA n=1 Tax=Candidatus Viadribacter manganicus TaxID=1759059 RepID=A0A1B1AHM7_9PROT|nr:RidA family protein [Candidatus Viadribacter manganicus]ANP46040.1 enamine deaminase RidA [Candidatus Viadribacter manganicus]
MRTLLPEGWPRPKGYANGIEADGRLVFVAGQIGWTPEGVFEANTLSAQFAQTLDNTLAILREANAGPEHIARMTWYITDKRAYLGSLAEIGAIWREKMGRNFPAMAVVEVKALIEDAALIEIETTAVVPR